MSKSKERPEQKQPARLRVLIADDVQETRRSTRLMLSLIPGVEVAAIAHNGRQAIEMARRSQPDIALMDVNMPEVDGLSAIRAMIAQRPELACIVISAERDSQTLQEAMAAGARGYLIKPFTADQLAEEVRRICAMVLSNRQRFGQTARLRQQRDAYLEQLANEYAKARRTDEKAMEVFEELATEPDCEIRWLMSLALIYVFRKQWGKLKVLAERLERLTGR